MTRCYGHYPHIALAMARALAAGPLRIHALTDALHRPGHTRKESKYAVNGAVLRMEAAGLIAYTAPCWALTARGRAALAQALADEAGGAALAA